MTKVTCDMAMSVDGFVAGTNQRPEEPFGDGPRGRGLIDELRLHVVPVILGAGERLFDGVADVDLEPTGAIGNDLVTHLSYRVVR